MISVITDDPVAYVRSLEKNGELQVTDGSYGEIVVTLDAGSADCAVRLFLCYSKLSPRSL